MKGNLLFRFVLCLFVSGLWVAEDGFCTSEILIGQSCDLKGSSRDIGNDMRNGALAYFKHVNGNGGINNRKIKLISLDDGYEPDKCVENTKRLIKKDKVFLLFGYAGTPTTKAVVDIIKNEKIPLFAPYTGAEFLRNPIIPEIFNVRASYYQETEAMVEALMMKGVKKIGVFYQNDSFGKNGLKGVEIALKKRKASIYSKASYERNTLNVEEAVLNFAKDIPEAIIMIGTYKPCAKFIKLARDTDLKKTLFLNISGVGADALATALANKGIGVVVSQVMPYPYDKRIAAVAEYHELTDKYMPPDTPKTFAGMEGFLAAKALCKVFEKMKGVTREEFIQKAESMYEYLDGYKVSFSPTSRQGSDYVHFSQVVPGGYINNVENFSYLYKYE